MKLQKDGHFDAVFLYAQKVLIESAISSLMAPAYFQVSHSFSLYIYSISLSFLYLYQNKCTFSCHTPLLMPQTSITTGFFACIYSMDSCLYIIAIWIYIFSYHRKV